MPVPFGPADISGLTAVYAEKSQPVTQGTAAQSLAQSVAQPLAEPRWPSYEDCSMEDLAIYGYANEPRNVMFERYIEEQRVKCSPTTPH